MEGGPQYQPLHGARGLKITELFLFDHFVVSNLLLLLLADLLLQAGLIFLNMVDLLLQYPTILDEVFKLRDGSLHHVEEGLQSAKPLFHLPTRWCIDEYLHGLRHSIKLITEFTCSPVAAFSQRGSQLITLPLIMPLILPEDLVNHVLKLEAPGSSRGQEVGQQAPEAVSSSYQRSQGCRLFTESHVQPVEPHGYP